MGMVCNGTVGNSTWLGNPEMDQVGAGKTIELNGGRSSKPCLIRGYHQAMWGATKPPSSLRVLEQRDPQWIPVIPNDRSVLGIPWNSYSLVGYHGISLACSWSPLPKFTILASDAVVRFKVVGIRTPSSVRGTPGSQRFWCFAVGAPNLWNRFGVAIRRSVWPSDRNQHPSSSVTLRSGPTATLADLSLANPKLPGRDLSWSPLVSNLQSIQMNKYNKNTYSSWKIVIIYHHIWVSSFWRPGGLLFSGVVLPSTGFSKKNPPSFDGGWPQRNRAWPVCGCYEVAGRVGLEPLQIPGRSGRLRTEDLEIHIS